ncbi:MAG: carboxypeptidase regulatory-like domain-containing protein [Acidimicrobiales bacterium]
MKTLKIATTTFGTGALLLALTVAPATVTFASTTAGAPSTHVTSEAPLTTGPSRSECLYPNFNDTGLASLQAAVTSFDTLTNSTVTCVSAYLNGATTWADWASPWVTNPSNGYTSWVGAAPQSRRLILAVNLIPNSLANVSDPLSWEQSCATGAFNSYATQLGANLVAAGLQNSVLRLGAEMNGTWEADFMGTTTQEQNLWATCFANEVTALRQATGENFLIDWNPNACKGAYPYTNFYPGNSYVDVVGIDLYDVDCNTPTTSVTFSQLANEPYGLTTFETFAAAQGKPMSFPEWGLSTVPSGDDPGYINGIGSAIANEDFAFATYFEGGGTNSKALALGSSTPLSLAAYQEWFGTPAPSAATISGVVTAAGGGDLAGICVQAFLNGSGIAAGASTAADGTYTISGLAPGSYGVKFVPGCGGANFATQWYNATATGTQSAPGTLVAVAAASPTAGVNAAMSVSTSISGTVSAAVGGADLAGLCVNAFSVGGTTSAGTAVRSAADGTYTIQGLLPGNYYVDFSAGPCGGNYVTQWYNATPTGASSMSGASEVAVTVASPATSINAAMSVSTSISGTVSAAVGGADLANMCVWAFPVGGGATESATTAVNGTYTIAGVAAGSYTVEFATNPCGGGNYATQWYNGTASGTPVTVDALAVSTSVASPATGVNAEMARGASISGTVTAAVGGSDVAGACVSVTSTNGGSGGSTITTSTGTYTLSGLAAGSYDVVVDPTCGGTVTTSYALPQPTSGPVTVISGETSTFNVPLILAGSIIDVITPRTNAPTNAVVGGATYSPNATATSGDNVQITLDGASTGCAINAGVVSFTVVGTCVIDFNDPSSGASDAYTSAVQVRQSFSVAATSSAGGGGGGGSGGGGGAGAGAGGGGSGGGTPPSPPVTVTPTPPLAPPTLAASLPTPREVTYTRNSMVLSGRAKDVLQALVKKLSTGGFITVIGYAHDNKALARRRADVVANFLLQRVSVHVSIKIITTSTVDKVMVITRRL